MEANQERGELLIDDVEMARIVKVLEQRADELGGHCLVFEDFECARCGGGDEKLGLDLHVPSDMGARYLSGNGRPLVMINVRLCADCIRWTTTDSAHETELVQKVLGGLQWSPEEDCGVEEKCGIVTPVFNSLVFH